MPSFFVALQFLGVSCHKRDPLFPLKYYTKESRYLQEQ